MSQRVFYVGVRSPAGAHVRWGIENSPEPTKDLPMRLDLWNHSPTGLEWGYGGSGPAQLALALASHVLGRGKDNDARAVGVHQAVKFSLVSRLPRDGWILYEEDVRAAVIEAENERKVREHYRAGH